MRFYYLKIKIADERGRYSGRPHYYLVDKEVWDKFEDLGSKLAYLPKIDSKREVLVVGKLGTIKFYGTKF